MAATIPRWVPATESDLTSPPAETRRSPVPPAASPKGPWELDWASRELGQMADALEAEAARLDDWDSRLAIWEAELEPLLPWIEGASEENGSTRAPSGRW